MAAYRIVIEAVTNAVRHSAADDLQVTLRRDAGALHIEVRDTGVGLAPSPVLGVGLASMRERAEELGGTCTLTSTSGRGTVVQARIPLAASTTREREVTMEALRVLVVDDHDDFRQGPRGHARGRRLGGGGRERRGRPRRRSTWPWTSSPT